MKIDKKRSRIPKKAIIIVAVVAALAIGGAVAAYQFGIIKTAPSDKKTDTQTATNQVDYGPATEEQKQAGTDAKKDFIERTEQEQNEPAPTPGVSSVSITTASQEGAVLRIRTTVSSQAAGNCTLTLSMAGQSSITREAGTQDMGSYSTCKGFDIDTASMAKGTWKASVSFSGDAEGAAATASVEVR